MLPFLRLMIPAIIAIPFLFTSVDTHAQPDTQQATIEGTIIFPVTDSIPQGIIFIPVHPNGLSDNMRRKWVYFQAMRWTQRDLLWEIKRCKKEVVVVEGIENHGLSLLMNGLNECYMTYGRLKLKVYNAENDDDDSKEYQLNLRFGGDVYNVRYESASRAFGIPMIFECLDW